jgi:hypothetical protein
MSRIDVALQLRRERLRKRQREGGVRRLAVRRQLRPLHPLLAPVGESGLCAGDRCKGIQGRIQEGAAIRSDRC